MGKKIAFFNPPFPHVRSYYTMIDLAAQYRHSAVELFNMFELKTPDEQAAYALKRYADEKNIRICCLSVCVQLVGDDAADQIEKAKRYADVARILGCPYLHHTIAIGRLELSEEEIYRRGIEATREIYDYAQSVGVRTLCEEQGYYFNGIDAFGRFLHDVGRDIGVVADLGNIYQHGGTATQLIELVKDKTVHVHVKDVVLTETNETGDSNPTTTGLFMRSTDLGHGCVEIKEAIDRLKQAGYDGYYTLELAAPADDSPAIDDAIRLLESWL